MLHDSARLGAIGCPGNGFTTASCSAYSIMNGVMTDGVSAGSNHVGASEMCTAHVTSPSGAAVAGTAMTSSASTSIAARTLTLSPPGDQPPEHGAVAKPVTLRQCRRALLEPRADRLAGRHVEAGHLALVPHEGGDLALDRVADVDDDVGLVG